MIRPFVTLEDFARISCMDGFALGVRTGSCDTCDYMMNPCLRRNLSEGLLANQHKAENILGFDLRAGYHSIELVWPGPGHRHGFWLGYSLRLDLTRRGISAINVKQSVTAVAGGPFALIYKLDSLTPANIGGKQVVTVPAWFLDNPDHAILRDHTSKGAQATLSGLTYPSKSGSNWLIEIDSHSALVDAYHCKYAYVTMATPVCVDGEIVAVYPGTEEPIPYAKDPVDNGDDTTTYTFYVWSLVAKEFREDEEISLEQGQYYKMLTELDFVCLKEVAALPVLTSIACPGCTDEVITVAEQDATLLKTTMIFDGVVDIQVENRNFCSTGTPLKIKIFYKSDPALLNIDALPLQEAIAYLTAAELTLKVCNCPAPTYGFIHQAQSSYGTLRINQITGEQTWQLAYGDRYGEIKFAQVMGKAYKVREAVRL